VVAIKPLVASALVAAVFSGLIFEATAFADSPTIRIDATDQARASSALLRPTDIGMGWRGGEAKPVKLNGSGCASFDPKVSDLVITGHANASFANAHAGVQVSLDTQVLQSAADVRTDFSRTMQPPLADCLASQLKKGPNITAVKVERIAFPKVGAMTAAYRGTITVKTRTGTAKVISDFVFVGDGRLEYSLNVFAPARYLSQLVRFEADMARIVVKRGATAARESR
jgi:hypothetical protein